MIIVENTESAEVVVECVEWCVDVEVHVVVVDTIIVENVNSIVNLALTKRKFSFIIVEF